MTIIQSDTHLENPAPGEYLVAPGVKFTVGDYGAMSMRSVYNPDDAPVGSRLFIFSDTENND